MAQQDGSVNKRGTPSFADNETGHMLESAVGSAVDVARSWGDDARGDTVAVLKMALVDSAVK